jgi:hypothetical protein
MLLRPDSRRRACHPSLFNSAIIILSRSEASPPVSQYPRTSYTLAPALRIASTPQSARELACNATTVSASLPRLAANTTASAREAPPSHHTTPPGLEADGTVPATGGNG